MDRFFACFQAADFRYILLLVVGYGCLVEGQMDGSID